MNFKKNVLVLTVFLMAGSAFANSELITTGDSHHTATSPDCFKINSTGVLLKYLCAKTIKDVVIPNSVTSIGELAFYDNQLTRVVIPNSVTSIGRSAFSYNQLTGVVIPNGVTSIGELAFYNNQLKSVVIPNSVTSISDWAFANNGIKSVVIPNSVTSISDWAFDESVEVVRQK